MAHSTALDAIDLAGTPAPVGKKSSVQRSKPAQVALVILPSGTVIGYSDHPDLDNSNALIRVDMSTYRYKFTNEGVISNYKNVLAYIVCNFVVSHNDLTVDEMVYLASKFAGDEREY
ncbi:hypothetical protein N7451_008300 [Penicillium sp. IBT 35674x]|nr:hypothetical protein N7451_008300 [Penicillium sp. IBT 35674x]